jgi:spermidine synthase
VALACKTVLAEFNDHALDDPRTNIIVADGRNYLFSTDQKYDVIVSEPPNIWVSGVSSLFTVEYYNIVKSHLKKDGLFSQWLPYYEMSEQDYKIALNTLHSVFPYLYEFNLGGDIIVLA